MRYAFVVLLLCGMAMGQEIGESKRDFQSKTITAIPAQAFISGTTATTTLAISDPTPSGPKKVCAFGFEPQVLYEFAKQKPHEPTAKERFDAATKRYSYLATATWSGEPMKWSCPYERAIELFGEDRVRFEEATVAGLGDLREPPPPREQQRCEHDGSLAIKTHCIYKVKRVLVDGEVVYEEGK